MTETGRVNLMVPGTPCLICSGQINPLVLAHEGESAQVRARMAGEGYLAGSDDPEPSMMPFNMQVAARGVQRFAQWMTGVHPVQSESLEDIRFFGLTDEGGIKRVRRRRHEGCLICGSDSAVAGAGDSQTMLVGPRPS